jgi:hypothetical protein
VDLYIELLRGQLCESPNLDSVTQQNQAHWVFSQTEMVVSIGSGQASSTLILSICVGDHDGLETE